MSSNILFLNGPNLNLLGQREQSQYGSITYEDLKKKCEEKCKELDLKVEFTQSNVEGEMVSIIQSANEKFDGIIINAAAFTHTSVAIRDALEIYKKKKIEVHISNIYSIQWRLYLLIVLKILLNHKLMLSFVRISTFHSK